MLMSVVAIPLVVLFVVVVVALFVSIEPPEIPLRWDVGRMKPPGEDEERW